MPPIPFDPSNISNNLTNYTMLPYTEGTGMGYTVLLIPISFVAIALYMKTQNFIVTAMFLFATCSLFAGVFIFVNAMAISVVYIMVSAGALTYLVLGFILRR